MSLLSGECVLCDQSRGDPVSLRIFGDEFYARYETEDGYTTVYDSARRCYCYATLAGGRLTSTGVPLHKHIPAGLSRHLQEEPSIRREKFERRYNNLRPREESPQTVMNRTLGPDDGLLEGRKLSQGAILGLTIIVDFADVKTNIQHKDVNDMLNGSNYRENGNYCSVREYFEIVSTNKLTYTNRVIGPITLARKRSHYIQNLLVKEVMDKVVNEEGVDLSDFDSQGDGIVDAINILYAGESQYAGDLWPHNSVKSLTYDGVRTHFYLVTGLGKEKVDLRIGTLCHENGHLLCRFPDMYDYGKRDGDTKESQGIGQYCLMGSGNHLNNRRTPSPVSAYLRDLAGWVDETVELNHANEVEMVHGVYNKVFKYRTSKVNEYFLLENRSNMGLDKHLPSDGLAIYHCDTLGSNEWQDGTRNRHYQCALLQADGHLDLENDRNAGDSGDLFAELSDVALSHETLPHSREWNGQDSGLIVSDVGEAGEIIKATVGPPVKAMSVSGEATPNLIIADNSPAGVTSAIHLVAVNTIKEITIGVHIIHSWIGDLKVLLRAPDGSEVLLHNEGGDDGDDILTTWASGSFSGLDTLVGREAVGDWQLQVTDNASADVGRLMHWSIELDLNQDTTCLEQSAQPNQTIPDNKTKGIESDIKISKTGLVKEVNVEVDIEHSYIGDLLVDLVSPGGHTVRLHDQEGAWQDNLKRTYSPANYPALQTLSNAEMKGDWILQVRDTAREDEGTLKSWTLKITY